MSTPAMSQSTESRIHAAASQNRALLSILAETDYASPALQQQKKYISDLENEISQLDASIQKLDAARQKEFKEHESYRNSNIKRFAYKVAGKSDYFQARASEEEKEYFDALQEEHQAKEARNWTQRSLETARATRAQFEAAESKNRQAQKDLDNLYDSIFSGPTPSFPEEDEREQNAERILQTYHDTRMKVEAEVQVRTILDQATLKTHEAFIHMESARRHSRRDMFGGGTITDMMERSALAKAQTEVKEVQMLTQQAQRISPLVGQIPQPNIAQGNIMSDVFFDNVFTDMAFHEKIKQSQNEVRISADAVAQEVHNNDQRLKDLNSKLRQEGSKLEQSRLALQKAREEIFERTVGGLNCPPSY